MLEQKILDQIKRLDGTLRTLTEKRLNHSTVTTPKGSRLVPSPIAQFLWGIHWSQEDFYYDVEMKASFATIVLEEHLFEKPVVAFALTATQFYISIDLDSPNPANPDVYFVDHDGSSREDKLPEHPATLLDWLEDMDLGLEDDF